MPSPSALPAPGRQDCLYLVDLSGYVFRAYHAIAPLSSSKGEPTHAVLGTVNMLQKVVNEKRPHMLAVAMDSKGRTFRHDLDLRYKSNRPAPPPDLSMQMARCEAIVRAYNIPTYQVNGLEADDLIASVVARALAEDLRVVIVSADKDLMQLVRDDDDRVLLWDSMRDKVYGPAEVQAKFGVPPEQAARSPRAHRRHLGQHSRGSERRAEDGERSPAPVRIDRRHLRAPGRDQEGEAEGGAREARGRRADLAGAGDASQRRRGRGRSRSTWCTATPTTPSCGASSRSSSSLGCSICSSRRRRRPGRTSCVTDLAALAAILAKAKRGRGARDLGAVVERRSDARRSDRRVAVDYAGRRGLRARRASLPRVSAAAHVGRSRAGARSAVRGRAGEEGGARSRRRSKCFSGASSSGSTVRSSTRSSGATSSIPRRRRR